LASGYHSAVNYTIIGVDWITNETYASVKFEFNDIYIYHCIRKTILIGDGVSAYITKYISWYIVLLKELRNKNQILLYISSTIQITNSIIIVIKYNIY